MEPLIFFLLPICFPFFRSNFFLLLKVPRSRYTRMSYCSYQIVTLNCGIFYPYLFKVPCFSSLKRYLKKFLTCNLLLFLDLNRKPSERLLLVMPLNTLCKNSSLFLLLLLLHNLSNKSSCYRA